MLGAEADDGIRAQPCTDHLGFGDRQLAALGEECEVVLHRFIDRLSDRERLRRRRRGERRQHHGKREHSWH
jgi:hypothetical protein